MSDTVRLFADAWKVMVGRLPGHHIEEGDGVVSCFGNIPLIFLNLSVIDRPAATSGDLRALLDRAKARASKSAHPAGLVVREDWLPNGWEAIVGEAGLAVALPMTGMEAGELLPPRRPPASLDIRRVDGDAGARDLAMVNAHAYHLPPEAFESMCNMHLWHDDSFGYVGYVDGQAVCAAAAFPVAGTVYIALVATLPGHQGKGYAEAVMRCAVTQGQRAMGTLRTTLHATDMGLPVYLAMGYTAGPRLMFLAPAE